MKHLADPLLLNVVQTVRRINGKANQDDVRVRVRQGTQTIVVLLAGGIPKRKFDVATIDFNIRDVVFENGRNVNLGGQLRLSNKTYLRESALKCHKKAKVWCQQACHTTVDGGAI